MGAPGMFTRALELARQSVDEAASGERVAVVAFDDRADVLAVPGGRAEARAALDGIAAGFGATRYGPVFQQAVDLAAGATGRLVVITDLQRAGWEGEPATSVPAGWSVEVRDVATTGEAFQNLAVSGLTIEADRLVAAIRNDGAMSRAGRIRVAHDRQQVATADYIAAPGTTTGVPIVWRAPESGAVSVIVDDPGGLPADDQRFVALAARGRSQVLVIADGGALYLSRALGASNTESNGEAVEVVPPARVAGLSDSQLASYRGMVLLSTRGLERSARERLMSSVKNGGGLFIAAAPELEPAVLAEMTGWQPSLTVTEQVGPLTLAATEVRHPIFRPFGALAANLGQVRFDRSWRVSPEGWSIVARFSNGTPALVERASGGGRVLLFASDVDRRWNDFPLHPAFVPFALESLRYVAADRRLPGDYTVAQAPSEAQHRPGVYRTADNRPFAVNVDPREGPRDRIDRTDFEGMVRQSGAAAEEAADRQAQQTESRQSFWQYGLVLMIATLVAESVAGRA
jgi:hypothetical protein